jgi:hypothetical protein
VSDATRLDDAEIGMIRDSGYFLGHSSVWLMCAQALAVFDISKRVENGVEITPEINLVGETIVFVMDIMIHCVALADARLTFQSSSAI